MYEEHPVFEKPSNQNIKVWRYMDFTKFVSLLNSESLFFSRADKFEDPFEGVYSQANKILRPEVYSDIPNQQLFFEKIDFINRKIREHTLINCWHINEHESSAMWKLYLSSNEGIAIQTTFGKLCESFSNTEDEVFLGKVKYVNYETDWIPEGNTFSPFLFKRKSFEHEHEVRAIVQIFSQEFRTENSIDINSPIYEYGKNIEVDLQILIENIYISPTSPKWFVDLIRSVLEKFQLNKNVVQSQLYNNPY